MADKDNVLFRTSVNGFNKSDVNSYIMKINAELEAADKTAENSKKETDKIKADLKDALSELEEAKKELAEQNSIISAQYEEIDALKEKLAALPERAEKAEDDSLSEKAELYEKMSAEIGDVLIDAKKSANEYLSRAKTKISGRSEKALGAITDDMREGVDGCFRETTAYMNAMQIEINRLLADFSGKNKSMNERIKALHSSLSKNINEEIDSMSEAIHPYAEIDHDKGKRSV